MLKLAIQADKEKDEILEFRLVKSSNGDLQVEGGRDNEWTVLGLRLVDGKVNFIRYRDIVDDDFNTNEYGQIEEVDE